jgi:flagellum-specific ATP synthase
LLNLVAEVERLPSVRHYGRVTAVQGLLVEISGVERHSSIGSRVWVSARNGDQVLCEVTGFRGGRALAMPFGPLEGVGLGCKVLVEEHQSVIYPDRSWLGRVIDAQGRPIDGGAALKQGPEAYMLRAAPPPPHMRQRVAGKFDLGVRSLNAFVTCCRGQRMGIFSGSGIGKSTILSMVARYSTANVNVIGLIGERGREVQEFLEDDLGAEGLARSVVVVATGDESALMRRQAAYTTMAIAEYFRDHDQDVLCLMDSVTRFAMAQREIGLSSGEPPTTKGYPPTVFSELPRLLERAGPGTGRGTITGLFAVLVEGDDLNEPITDAVRGILDGHIVLDRAIAERGRFPAVNVLRSVSRTMPMCNDQAENALVTRARQLLATYENMAELIRIGAYRPGSDPAIDEALKYQPSLEKFLSQDKNERATLADCYAELAAVLGVGENTTS